MTAETDGAPPNLVVLYPEPDVHDDEQPVTKAAGEGCSHWKVRLDPEARRVFCRGCDREVDPFTILLRYAQEWDRIKRWRIEAERRSARARDRLDEILRLERNARSRLRRVDPDAAPPAKPWGEGLPL